MTVSYEDIDGIKVRVQRRSNARSIRLRVSGDGEVRVSAPPYASRSEIRRIVTENRGWIAEQRAKFSRTPQAQAAQASAAEQAEWKALVEAFVPALLEKWEPVIGVRHKTLAFRNMKSRWGSCQPRTGRICINTRLALYPPECLEYVVVHELCHMLVPDHGPRFKALLDEHLPTWRDAERKLRA